MTSFVVPISTAAPMSQMVKPAAKAFEKLREIVRLGCGHDFLAKCADVMRPANFTSQKKGVADRSWHKTGRAFDHDQTADYLVVVSEPHDGKQYFRTYLKCTAAVECTKRTVHDYRGYAVTASLYDFTAAAEGLGFHRIPAWRGWEHAYNLREFWHYQFDEGMSWDAAMRMLKANNGDAITQARSSPAAIIGLNDRDQNAFGIVTKIQTALALAGLLPTSEIDGVFGDKTRNAVQAFQRLHGLEPDGIVGPKTFELLQRQ